MVDIVVFKFRHEHYGFDVGTETLPVPYDYKTSQLLVGSFNVRIRSGFTCKMFVTHTIRAVAFSGKFLPNENWISFFSS